MENAEALLVARAGHWVQFERADLFNRLVTDFVKGDLA
jgi:2-hydroxy-6-oxonona-2,4-dienedioate hydrolase/4,5:9,10-diseco-3-hydroxy-5,9,17-trioxoandrosta-1(10),2-diene-4-oate hydrolase